MIVKIHIFQGILIYILYQCALINVSNVICQHAQPFETTDEPNKGAFITSVCEIKIQTCLIPSYNMDRPPH